MPTDTLTLALAQLNPTVGDLAGNAVRLRAARDTAAAAGADLVIATEHVVSGYPLEDLVLKDAFVDAVMATVEDLARATADGGPALLVGTPWRAGGHRYNAVALLDGGAIQTLRYKHCLPNYGVFDEARHYTPGAPAGPINFRGVRLGVGICEDMWTADVPETLAEAGAEILIFPNGSPYERDKIDERLNLAVARVTETGLPLIYENQVGGQDELVFDGASFVLNGDRALAVHQPAFREDVAVSHWHRNGADIWECAPGSRVAAPEGCEAIYRAMMLGLHDYVEKNGFPGVVLGLSGGIDSALTAAVAADALGADRVHCLMMPSPYTSRESLDDAAEFARNLGVRLDDVPIVPAMEAFDGMLAAAFDAPPEGVTRENIQARARGLTLMAVSNATGAMLLTTGNKSEMSVGYATLYGDMCGGYSVLKDVYKTDVFTLCRWRNANLPVGALGPDGAPIPERIITRPPSAELRPDQKDADSLPPYDALDAMLHGLIDEDLGIAAVAARGHDSATVERVWHLVRLAEYKRRQAPPGVKLTRRAFGRDRRYPITNACRGA